MALAGNDHVRAINLMTPSQILAHIPADVEWMVLFDLPKLRSLVSDETLRGAFLAPKAVFDGCSHMVRTNIGSYMADSDFGQLVPLPGAESLIASRDDSLAERYAEDIALLSIDDAHCVGLGEYSPWSPVIMQVVVDEAGLGLVTAVFDDEPDLRHFGWLRAAGVTYQGGERVAGRFLAGFRNRVPTHLLNAALADYSRTAHCNRFFLQHAQIDPTLLAGLKRAAAARIAHGAATTVSRLIERSEQFLDEQEAMVCQPPPPEPAHPMGDLVPLGIVLASLRRGRLDAPAARVALKIRDHLEAHRQGTLWSFQTNGLVTATDSALILLGMQDSGAVELLEQFADGAGGYYPQRWAITRDAMHMAYDETVRPWCQPDFGTTCLIRSLRRRYALPESTALDYLEARFDNRGSLYFANPYLLDWVLAESMHADPAAATLRRRLRDEIVASQSSDQGFGRYDRSLSTALAILALHRLGEHGAVLRLAQLRLLSWVDDQAECSPSTPFYSVLHQPAASQFPRELMLYLLRDGGRHVFSRDQRYYAITQYIDEAGVIGMALVAAALALPIDEIGATAQCAEATAKAAVVHPRYQCNDPLEYVREHALLPYLDVMEGPPPIL